MGWISMSERDLKRIEVLSEVRTGRRTVTEAAAVLEVSERQTYRLPARYERDGAADPATGGASPVPGARALPAAR